MKKYYGHTLLYLHETAAALSELGQICAVDGLTGIYIGPADLAISMGADVVGAIRHPEVLNAIGRIHRVLTRGWSPAFTRETAKRVGPWRSRDFG